MTAPPISPARRRRRLSWLASFAATLTTPTLVQASTPNDVLWGEGVDVQTIKFTIDGESQTTRGVPVYKAPNSLFMWLPLSLFGLPGSDYIPATGVANGDKILWSFQKHNLGIPLGDLNQLDSVVGWIEVVVDPLPPEDVALCWQGGICTRNAKLTLNNSQASFHGTNWGVNWSEPVAITAFEAEAGLRLPAVSAMWGPSQVNQETDNLGNPKHFQAALLLEVDGTSPSSGTVIALDASVAPGSGFNYPEQVFVPPGQTSASVLFNIYPQFMGRVQLVATSSSNQWIQSFTVLPPVHEQSENPWIVNDHKPLWEELLDCIHCGILIDWADPLGPVMAIEEDTLWIQGQEAFSLGEQDLFVGAELADFGANGWVTGMTESQAAFVARFDRGEVLEYALLPGSGEGAVFLPRAVDGLGNVAGDWLGEGELPVASLWPRGAEQAFPLGVEAEGSEVRAFHPGGYVVGTTFEGHGFIAELAGGVELFEPPEGADALVFDAVNGAGVAAGYVLDGEHLRAAYRGLEGEVLAVPELDGYADHWAVGVTAHGDVLINASEGEAFAAFVGLDDNQEWLDADEFLPPESDMHVQRFTHVDSNGFLAFEATYFDEGGEGEGTFTTHMF